MQFGGKSSRTAAFVSGEAMRLSYDTATDSLYIHLSEQPGADANEVADGVVLDFAADGKLVGIDVQHASTLADLSRFLVEHVPAPLAA